MDDVYVQNSEEEFKKLLEECKPFMKEEDSSVVIESTDKAEIKMDGFSPIFKLFTFDKGPENVAIEVKGSYLLIPRSKFKSHPRIKQLKDFYKYLSNKGVNIFIYTYGPVKHTKTVIYG